MNPITGWLAAAAFLFMLIGVAYVAITDKKKSREKQKELEEEIKKQQATIVDMYKHVEELALIQKGKSEVDQKIKEAKTDEELAEIISSIVAINNSKLRK
jgi:cytochrome c-type biogenesis protein CcmH/NrfF